MIILRQRLYFERTKEMEETAKNLKNAKDSVIKSTKNIIEKVKHPGKTIKVIRDKVVDSVKHPGKIGKALKNTGKKAWNFAKKNPRYAVYMGAGYGVPILIGKAVEKKKGKKAGVAATATLTALPLGEAAIGLDKLVTSKGGRTGLKATGQVIKGVVTDLGKKIIKRKIK